MQIKAAKISLPDLSPILLKNQPFFENHFTLIRLFLALAVVLDHLAELSQNDFLSWITHFPRISCFFILSGFLVFRSYERASSTKDFLIKRFSRIYPAYAIAIALGVILGAFLTSINITQYLTSIELYKYIGYNLMFMNFMQPTLPGVFEHNYIQAVNGALWTLKIEVMFYFAVPLIIFMTRFIKRDIIFLMLYVISALYLYIMAHASDNMDEFYRYAKQLPGQLMYFIFGAFIYYHLDKLSKIPFLIIIPSYVLYIIAFEYNMYFLFPVVLSGFIFPIAFMRTPITPGFIRKNDISYGLYLFHFPVIQWFCDQNYFNPVVPGVTLFFILLLLLAYGSWTLVERKRTQRK